MTHNADGRSAERRLSMKKTLGVNDSFTKQMPTYLGYLAAFVGIEFGCPGSMKWILLLSSQAQKSEVLHFPVEYKLLPVEIWQLILTRLLLALFEI